MQDLNENIQIIYQPPSQIQDNLETNCADINTETMVDVPTFDMSTQTLNGLVVHVVCFIHILLDLKPIDFEIINNHYIHVYIMYIHIISLICLHVSVI